MLRERKKPPKSKYKGPSNYKLLKTSWQIQGKLFFEQSTLHGVRYIAEAGRPFFEKFMWFVCVAIGAIATIVIIVSLWEKFQTNPTITGLDTDFHNWEVRFPAVTICSSIPGDVELIDGYVIKNSNVNGEEELKQFLTELTQLTFDKMKNMKNLDRPMLSDPDVNLKEFLYSLMMECDNVFANKFCKWKVENASCCESFKPVFTENGFCYTFNSRHFENFGESEKAAPFEVRLIKETDIKWSMQISLQSNTYFANILPVVQVYIHNSDEMPGLDIKPQLLWGPLVNVDRISFSVKQTYTTDDARQLSIKQRHCVFEDEIKLKTDYIYTFTACTRQCRMDTARKHCGCVPHFYPIISGYRQCKLSELACIHTHLERIKNVDRCNCQLGCSNTVYEVEKINDSGANNESSLEAEFVSWPMVRYKREVLFGWVDLLVSFGGIAGLFLGFSLLSAVEVVYYFTIRACCMVYQEKDELETIHHNNKAAAKPNYDMGLKPSFVKKSKYNKVKDINYENNITTNYNKNNKIEVQGKVTTVLPPFGIEFIN